MKFSKILVNFECLLVLICGHVVPGRLWDKQEHAYYDNYAKRESCYHEHPEVMCEREHNDSEGAHESIEGLRDNSIEVSVFTARKFDPQDIRLQEVGIQEAKEEHVNENQGVDQWWQIEKVQGAGQDETDLGNEQTTILIS